MQTPKTQSVNQHLCERKALDTAYQAVMSRNYSHSKLFNEYEGVNLTTLERVRDHKRLQNKTIWFYLQLFVLILLKQYNFAELTRDLEKTMDILKICLKILRELFGI